MTKISLYVRILSVRSNDNEKKKMDKSAEQLNKKPRRLIKAASIIIATAFLAIAAVWAGRFIWVENVRNYKSNGEKPAYDPDAGCSIYIYMCGSNLESKYGLASGNIQELLAADIPENTNVIIQTGGASKWWHDLNIAPDKLQRYKVEKGSLTLLEEKENASMGSPGTLSDFLSWGAASYPADRNMLIIWDHGGSSAEGVCYDENYDLDNMDMKELSDALGAAHLPDKFDMISFDTCYMGSLETAAVVQDFGHYMTASQLIVPGGGLDYKVLAEGFSQNDDEAFGRLICDSFMDKCNAYQKGDQVQLSLYDLSATAVLTESVENAAENLKLQYDLSGDAFEVYDSARNAQISESEEKVNVMDLQTFWHNTFTQDTLSLAREIKKGAEAAVVYQVKGKQSEGTGMSLYYPFDYKRDEVELLANATPLKNYAKLLESVYEGLPGKLLEFEDAGSLDDKGVFSITLTEESRQYLHGIECRVQKKGDKVSLYSFLYEGDVGAYDNRLQRRFAKLTARSTFDGQWLALDGHLLMTHVNPGHRKITYTSPVCVNGEDTVYSFVRKKLFGKYILLSSSLGSSVDENGLPTRNTRNLQKGDRINVYSALDTEGKSLKKGEEFVIEDDNIKPESIPLPYGDYRYKLVATDILGNEYESKYCYYRIDENGVEAVGVE